MPPPQLAVGDEKAGVVLARLDGADRQDESRLDAFRQRPRIHGGRHPLRDHLDLRASSWRYGESTASQSASFKRSGRSRLHRSTNSSPARLAMRALDSSTATVSIPTRWGRQQAVTSMANRLTQRM